MIVAALIVGEGEGHRYLDRTLRLARTWADRVVALADNPDDDTVNSLKTLCHKVIPSMREGEFHEQIVRNKLLAYLDGYCQTGDIVVSLDADEELQTIEGGNPRMLLESYHHSPCDAWKVRFYHLWSPDGKTYRTDGGWTPAAGHRVYRHRRGLRILLDKALGCPPIPDGGWTIDPVVQLRNLHWGYARPHDRPVKHERYVRLDGGRFHSMTHLNSIIQEPTLESL